MTVAYIAGGSGVVLLVWTACYLVHTWLLTSSFMWLHKFADNTIAVVAKVGARRWRT